MTLDLTKMNDKGGISTWISCNRITAALSKDSETAVSVSRLRDQAVRDTEHTSFNKHSEKAVIEIRS